MSQKFPVVIGDIGGTNVRLRFINLSKDFNEEPELVENVKFSPKDYPSLEALFEQYLAKFKDKNYPLYAVIGIPGPVKNNSILKLVNIPHWPESNGDELAKKLGLKQFVFLNDFTCASYGIQAKLKLNEDYIVINDVTPQEGGAKTVIGPGTGLGMGFLVKDPENEFYTIGSSEGGHQDFTPKTQQLFDLKFFTQKLLGQDNLSVERMLSGQALIPMYKFLLEKEKGIARDEELGKKIDAFNDMKQSSVVNEINIELVKKGLDGKCALSKKVLELFIEVFGEVAGDVSLFTLPSNGLYLVGGLTIALEQLIKGTSIFMDHFLNKDSFAFLLKTFPIYLVKNPDVGVLGAAECARRLLLKNEK